ncbi:MAG: phospho-N-acetylmuramoyl-pentapeptide-transferase [Candidatus Cloacimonetes bacterium 4572_55]|nr:MAG: phospho-N-acetylmuramoyl-pentapeptide-transferase [Candidatus Cloacimonetes bacterium 4572_55]
MFYFFLYPLSEKISAFNVFKYITFRSAYATITALLISFLVGPYIIRRLRKWKIEQIIRIEGPESHLKKSGTPTMGGLILFASILFPTLLWADLTNRYIQLILLTTIWMAGIGFMDDYLKVVHGKSQGLIARYKMIGQIGLGIIIGIVLYFFPMNPELVGKTVIPFWKGRFLDFNGLYIPFVILVVTSSSNAVNLTDGLDGLAIGLVAISAVTLAGFCYVEGHIRFSEYLNIPYLRGIGELTVFSSALIGASLGFLWFNSHPAEIFMGDTGSLMLGGIIGVLAILIKQELLLIILGGVFVVEALSVILQVGSYKMRNGKRIFRMAPIHHHFELKGWSETKIVTRFWIIGILLSLVTLSTLKLR